MEKSREELLQEVEMLRREIRVAREAAQTTAEYVVRQFEQTQQMLHRFQTAHAERQAVLDAATQMSIIATDMDGMIRLFSTGASTLLGYRPDEMVGKRSVLSFHLRDELERYGEQVSGVAGSILQDMKVFDQFVKQRQSRAQEWTYLRKNGTQFPVSLSVTGLYNPDGRMTGYLFAAMDMTLQKEMEQALVEAKEAAESANASKGDFLARMSHEIRTPMNGVIGMASLLEKTPLTSKQRNYVEKLIGSANTLLHLINDILDFSKIDAGRLRLEHVVFNFEDILGNLGNVVGLQAEKKGLEFLFRIDPQVPNQLVGDPLRLGQILMNLAGNAVKFTERGEVVISVTVEHRHGRDLMLKCSVKDSGIGLSAEQIDTLFSAFHQADDSITRKYGGTGLGLAICKQLTELMGGTIWVDSEPDRGSEFFFTARLQCPENRLSTRLRSADQLRGLRALVVDDNAIARDVLSSMLRSLTMDVDTAVDGEAAIGLLEETTRRGEQYDVILLDWLMPGIDGIETARRIKAHREIGGTPAMLMVSANAREEAYVEAKNVGLDAFLLKPVYASIMHDTLLDILGTGHEPVPGLNVARREQIDLEPLRGARVLLVDDNVINQEVAAEFLRAGGMEVTVAVNGYQSIEALERERFDVVLMDIQMPEMDGLEATRRIRKDSRFDELPVIAMTAHAMTGDRDKSLAAGMNDHITKPIDQFILYQTLKKWIATAGDGRERGARQPMEAVPEVGKLPNLPGIDSEQALRVLSGNVTLFKKMLLEFKHKYALLPTQLRELSEAGNWAEIGVVAHTLKGIAGYLGSPDLGGTARALEDAIRGQRFDEAGGLLIAFIDLIDNLLSAVSMLPEPAPIAASSSGKETGGGAPLQDWVQRLIGQLERGEAAAEQQFAVVRDQCNGYGVDDLLQRIAAAIDDIEYADAIGAAYDLLQTIGQRREKTNAL